MNVALALTIIILASTSTSDKVPTCQPKDFHYEYTECDSAGNRWRVSVPKPGVCQGGAPNPPVQGKGCGFTCKSGQYLDIQGNQDCLNCPAGTYSLGGGVRFEDWDHLPKGFTVKTEGFQGFKLFTSGINIGSAIVKDDDQEKDGNVHSVKRRHVFPSPPDSNCTESGWFPKGSYIASQVKDCSSSLGFSATLVQPGAVSFTYQYTDDNLVFRFMVQNSECQTVEDKDANRWPPMTAKGDWKTITVNLKTGLNMLYWKTIGVGTEQVMTSSIQPVLIKRIEITGVAFTSECTKCRNGTYSQAGHSTCQTCPQNTFSGRGAKMCTKCDAKTEYSDAGASKCTKRKACQVKDYFDYYSACDENRKTQKMYRWIAPKLCREDLPGAVKLPAAGPKEACPPCNRGMEFRDGACHFCPKKQYSDGSEPCADCPASTAPMYMLEYRWWNNLPNASNISSSCLSMSERGCADKTGWQAMSDHMHSGKGHADDAYLVLTLRIGGFSGVEGSIGGKAIPVGKISFVFELDCTEKCLFYFMERSKTRGTSVVETWKGKQPKKQFSYTLTRTDPVTFTWAFQKKILGWNVSDKSDLSHVLVNDAAKIYSLNVTNVLEGSAPTCKVCPRDSELHGCIPCPAGSYIETNSSKCVTCPGETVVHGSYPWGIASCKQCGEGLVAKEHTTCSTDCLYKSPDGKEYDFTQLAGINMKSGTKLFTSSGTHYYHMFNISLCANDKHPMAQCTNNISQGFDPGETVEVMQSMVCRSTIIPPRKGEDGKIMSAQPVSLGDALVNITTNGSSLNMAKRLELEGYEADKEGLDVHFTYMSETPTAACRHGRTLVITLRCAVNGNGNGTIELPPHCPDGTCDGCNFHFVWHSKQACPQCKEDNYEEVVGQCSQGWQTIHYIPPKHCILLGKNSSKTHRRRCSPLPFWLEIFLFVVFGVGLLLIITLVYCWKKNRKLEYRYMKLVASSGGKDDELPAAETCAIDEGEEEDQFDAVRFKESKGKKLFNKLKAMTKRSNEWESWDDHEGDVFLDGEDDNPFESVQLTEKESL